MLNELNANALMAKPQKDPPPTGPVIKKDIPPPPPPKPR